MKNLSGYLNTEQRKWLLIISACLLKLVSGQTLSGGVFANCMKTSFGLSQRQLDFCMALVFLGSILVFLSGFFYDRFGAQACVIVSGVFSTLLSLCLTLCMAYAESLRNYLWLLYIVLFLYGHSFNYSYVAAVACCMSSFQASRRGCIMSLIDNSFSLGVPFVALIYYVTFDNTHRSQSAQDPIGTLIVMTVFTAVVHTFAFCFLVPLDGPIGELSESKPILQHEKSELEENTSAAATGGSLESPRSQPAGHRQKISELTREILAACSCSGLFLSLMLGFVFTFAPNAVLFLNLTSISRSLGLSQYDVYYFWFPLIATLVTRGLIGPLTDRYFYLAYQRSAVLLICLVGLGIPSAVMMSSPLASGVSPLGVTVAASILEAMSTASIFTLVPVIISQTEAQHIFGSLYSCCLVIGSFLVLLLMLQFGALYDLHSVAVNVLRGNGSVIAGNSSVPAGLVEYECKGQACYVYGGLANLLSHLLSMVCLIYFTAVSLKSSRS